MAAFSRGAWRQHGTSIPLTLSLYDYLDSQPLTLAVSPIGMPHLAYGGARLSVQRYQRGAWRFVGPKVGGAPARAAAAL